MNKERNCARKRVKSARSRLPHKRYPSVLTLRTAVVGTVQLLRDQTDRDAEFAKTCMSGYAVCGRNTVGKKRTGMSGKVSLTDIDTVALSRAESVDQAKKRWTILDTRGFS